MGSRPTAKAVAARDCPEQDLAPWEQAEFTCGALAAVLSRSFWSKTARADHMSLNVS